MMGFYIILYISTLVPVWELATCCDVTEGTDWCGLVPVVREFLDMHKKNQYISNFNSPITCTYACIFVKCSCSNYFFPQICKSDMSRYGYLEVFHSPVDFEITRVDCTWTLKNKPVTFALYFMGVEVTVFSTENNVVTHGDDATP